MSALTCWRMCRPTEVPLVAEVKDVEYTRPAGQMRMMYQILVHKTQQLAGTSCIACLLLTEVQCNLACIHKAVNRTIRTMLVSFNFDNVHYACVAHVQGKSKDVLMHSHRKLRCLVICVTQSQAGCYQRYA